MANNVKQIIPPVEAEADKRGNLEERIKLFMEWERQNPEYILDIALWDNLCPVRLDSKIPQLTAQEWMVYIIESMLAEVRYRHQKFMQQALDEASTKETTKEG